MKLGRCPVCHSELHLDAILEDDAARELVALLATKATHGTARHLVAYIGLFRPEKSNLSNSRSVKLLTEVFELYAPSRHLAHALGETVKQIREKRAQGQTQPLSNHNYLKKVYESTKELFIQSATPPELTGEDNALRKKQEVDAYFKQMQKLKVDITTLPGGKAWLATQG